MVPLKLAQNARRRILPQTNDPPGQIIAQENLIFLDM